MPKSTDIKRARPQGMPLPVRLAAWAAAVFLVLSVLGVTILHVPSVQKEIIRRAVGEIRAATGYEVDIRSYKCWPFSRLYLEDVKVQADGRQILTCEKVGVSYSVTAKWPHVILDEVSFEKPFLQLERAADGKWQVPEVKPPGGAQTAKPEAEPFWVHAVPSKVRIRSGSIEARQQGNVVLSVKNITGSLHIQAVPGEHGPKIRVDLDKLRAEAEKSPLGAWRMEASAALDEKTASIRNISLSGPDDARIALSGEWDSENFESGKVSLVVSNLSAKAVPLLPAGLGRLENVSGSLSVARDGARWSVEHDITSAAGGLKGVLAIEENGPGRFGATLDTTFRDVKPQGAAWLPESDLNGRIELTASFDGLKPVEARFSASLDSSTVGAERIEKCDLSGTFEKDVLTVNSSTLKSSLADLKLSAVGDLAGAFDPGHAGRMRAEVSIERANLEKIYAKLRQKIGGTISLEAQYERGQFFDPRAWQSKASADLNVPDALVLKASAVYRNEQLKADYDVDLKDVRKLSAFFPQWQGQGRVLSKGTFSGKINDLTWEGQVDWPGIRYGDLKADQISFKGKGKLADRDERHELSIKAQNVAFEEKKAASLAVDLDQQKSGCAFQLRGEGIFGKLSARLSGRVERIWDFPAVAVSTQGQVGWKDQPGKEQSGSLDCRFEVDKDSVRIHSASLVQGKQKIVVSGGIVSDAKTEMKLSVESLNAGQVVEALGFKNVFSGTLSGQATIGGKPDQPECRLTLQGTNCIVEKQHIESVSLTGSYSRDLFSIQGEAKSPALSGPLGINAKIPLHLSFKPPRIEVKQTEGFGADIQVAGLKAEALLPYLDFLSKAGGTFHGDIHCAGSLKQPVVSGAGTWKEGMFQEKRWAHPADRIQGEWQLDSKNLYVRKAEVSHLGGTVAVTGYIGWPQFNTLYFKGEAKDLNVPDIYGIEGKVSGHAEITDSPQAAELTGSLVFSKAKMNLGRLETDIAQNIQIIEADRKGNLIEVAEEDKSLDKFNNRLKMNVALQLPPTGTWVTGKGLKAEITGGLKLEKNPSGSIRLAGELQALRGTYSFQGRELKILEGSMVFTGTPEPDPQVRILCEKKVRDVTLQALVQGRLSRPKLAMSSIPAMDQVDIVSYFMFDHPAGDLSASEKSQFQDRAASWLGSETSKMIKSVFGNNPLAPDAVGYRNSSGKTDHSFAYNPSTTTSTGQDTGIVEVGKYITPDLYVTYGRGVTGEEGNQVQIEYRLNRHISVQTQVGGAEQSGVDIFWRHDFGK